MLTLVCTPQMNYDTSECACASASTIGTVLILWVIQQVCTTTISIPISFAKQDTTRLASLLSHAPRTQLPAATALSQPSSQSTVLLQAQGPMSLLKPPHMPHHLWALPKQMDGECEHNVLPSSYCHLCHHMLMHIHINCHPPPTTAHVASGTASVTGDASPTVPPSGVPVASVGVAW